MQNVAARHLDDLAGCSDAVLVDFARQGEEAAMRVIIQRHNRRLYRTARAILRDDSEAEDVVQEVYLRAFAALDGFRGEASLSTWLTRIALNEALGRLRRRRPTSGLEAVDAAAGRNGADLIVFPGVQPPASPESEMARGQIRLLLERAIDELPESFRVVFILRDIEEMSIEQTALHLSLKPETVKTRLHRARRLIRAALSKQVSSAFAELFPFGGSRCDRMTERVMLLLRSRAAAQPLP